MYATLMFRVGRADETLATLGTTHLVEHLAMFPVGRPLFQANAMVDDTRTLFFAEGTLDEVAGFLETVVRALGELPLDRLAVERRVLQTESAAAPPDFHSRLMNMRFGPHAHGLGHYLELGLRSAAPERVEEWARERFSAANAAVWMSTRPPAELTLPLPAGRPFRPPEPEPIPRLRIPSERAEGTGGVAMTFLVRRSIAALAAAAIAGERMHERLRLQQGITYAVDGGYVPLTAETAHSSIGVDCIDANAVAARDGMQAAMDELAEHGPSTEELERYVAGSIRAMGDPDHVMAALDRAASDHLYGKALDQPAGLAEELRALTPEAVAAAMREALATEIVLVPEGVERGSERFAAYGAEDPPRVQGRTFRGRRRGLRRAPGELVLGDDGVTLLHPEGDVTIAFGECVAVVEGLGGNLTLLGRGEQSISFAPADIEDGDELETALRERLHAGLFIPPEEHLAALETLAGRLSDRARRGPELAHLAEMLAEGEAPAALAEASRRLKIGLLAVTDRRLVWLYEGRKTEVVEVPAADIRGVDLGGEETTDLFVATPSETLKFTDITPADAAAGFYRTLTTLSEA